MNAACSPESVVSLFPPTFCALVLAGCDTTGNYPADMTYPLRTDPIVGQSKLPGAKKDYAYPPGALDKAIYEIVKEGGTLLIPSTLPGRGATPGATQVFKNDNNGQKLRRGVFEALEGTFGTPARPRVTVDPNLPNFRVVSQQLDRLKLDRKGLEEGSRLYRRNCMHCHGVTGDGRGPTGPWVSPHPRDYRLGKFKFTSTGKEARPSRTDLYRTVYNGLDGSTMPSFSLNSEKDLDNMVSYVIHLSIRGELEVFLMEQIASEEIQSEHDIPKRTVPKLVELIQKWTESNDTQLKPDAGWFPEDLERKQRDEDIRAGYKLFFNKDLNCAGCHVDFGRQAQFQYDNWGTLVRPNNLTNGIYRGGRRPIDFFWRIRSGIVVMAAFPKDHPFKVDQDGKKVDEKLDDKKVGQLVRFIQALPYPAMLPDDLREQIYGVKPEPRKPAGEEHH